MRVVVFGANGYIGNRTVLNLAAHAHEVTGFVRSESAATAVRAAGATAVVGSLTDAKVLESVLATHEAIVWLVQLALEDEQRVVDGLLRAIRKRGKTFVFTGGASVLSESTAGEWSENVYSEGDSFVPRRQLRVRAETENIVRVASQYGVRSIVVRPPLVYGHGGCKVISDLYHSARQTGAVCYIGRGLNVYSHCHVDDVAELIRLAIERGSSGALYHCVAGESTYRSMAEAIARSLEVATRSVSMEEAEKIWDKFTATTVFSSCSRTRSPGARRELGWAPQRERSDILAECLQPAYAAETGRNLASWIQPGNPSASTNPA